MWVWRLPRWVDIILLGSPQSIKDVNVRRFVVCEAPKWKRIYVKASRLCGAVETRTRLSMPLCHCQEKFDFFVLKKRRSVRRFFIDPLRNLLTIKARYVLNNTTAHWLLAARQSTVNDANDEYIIISRLLRTFYRLSLSSLLNYNWWSGDISFWIVQRAPHVTASAL